MGIKKKLIIIFIILILFSAHLYLKDKYNPMAVEINYSGNLTINQCQKLKKKYKLNTFSINYERFYNGHTLIMTSGLDTQIRKIEIIHGQYLSDISELEAVIGDKVVQKYFKTQTPLGRSINILGKEFKIIGVEKNSNIIYIPFNDELLSNNWEKKRVIFNIPNSKEFYITIQKIENELKLIGINIIDKVIYKEKIYGYLNLLIILGIIILAKFLRKLIKRILDKILSLWYKYKKANRIVDWNKYLLIKKTCLAKIIAEATIVIALILGIFKIMSYLKIPPSLLPDNFFSLTSYINIVKLKYNSISLHLQKGFSNITIDTIYINFIIILLFTVTVLIEKAKRNID
ncbi:ABC transporter permease [Thermohalobacter berrensis]|uniref:MacB-like periplasmic core domain-containing protein n=1 Tax=Thermohalobacter berrensis TaxID=99594 RepID=A0A419T3B4_9FIRM|nr:ABC transporter permease [Thermohalobacter berrensis]RKD31952.1 hypothetical protein BET03_11770 [Thermohalobacter berrensis]